VRACALCLRAHISKAHASTDGRAQARGVRARRARGKERAARRRGLRMVAANRALIFEPKKIRFFFRAIVRGRALRGKKN